MAEVTCRRDTHIAWLTISNPARYNAMSQAMWEKLAALVGELDQDADIRVIVVRGDGDKAFISGADISEFGERADSPEAMAGFSAAVDRAERALCECGKPVIAMIRGICMGGGIGLCVSSDLRYCTRDSRFRMPAARLGLGYAADSMARIVDVMGAPRAAELFYTARTFDGTEAERVGLVHQAFDDVQLEAQVQSTAAMVAANAPLSLRAAKLAIAATRGAAQIAASQVHEAVRDCYDSSDYIEGRTAFMEKREAQFCGR